MIFSLQSINRYNSLITRSGKKGSQEQILEMLLAKYKNAKIKRKEKEKNQEKDKEKNCKDNKEKEKNQGNNSKNNQEK